MMVINVRDSTIGGAFVFGSWSLWFKSAFLAIPVSRCHSLILLKHTSLNKNLTKFWFGFVLFCSPRWGTGLGRRLPLTPSDWLLLCLPHPLPPAAPACSPVLLPSLTTPAGYRSSDLLLADHPLLPLLHLAGVTTYSVSDIVILHKPLVCKGKAKTTVPGWTWTSTFKVCSLQRLPLDYLVLLNDLISKLYLMSGNQITSQSWKQ